MAGQARSRPEPFSPDQPHFDLEVLLTRLAPQQSMANSQKMADTAEHLKDIASSADKWASPATQVFAFIGLLWLSLKIFSFWRMIASLFILPGISVRCSHDSRLLYQHADRSLAL